ncbi:Mll2248 protein [Micrococcus lylae]|uniref:Mll2248 protein n=1 Tax=Micrococcus lylae TaxID=1273 RepID=A0A1R4JH24_9MICC|nr:hypothetical protein HMPREF2863_04445 [Micrococcus sp. HMSC067E09]SJN31326.1 Mll2248 protein [Micrococcus lylae]
MRMPTPTSAAAPRPRLLWMDVYRGLAVLLVVLLHAQTALVDSGLARSELVRDVNAAVGSFRMPGLLLVSGMLLTLSLRRPAGQYLAGKLRRIAWPWLLWTAVMLPFFGLAAALEPTWWLNGAHTWFLSVVFVGYLLGLALKRVPPLIIAVVLFALAIRLEPDAITGGLHEWALVAERMTWFGGFFFVGAALGRWREDLPRIPWQVMLLPAVVTWDWARRAIEAGRYPSEESWPVMTMSVIGVVSVLWLLAQIPDNPLMRAFAWVGRHSIVLFVVHYPVIRLLRRTVDLPEGIAGVGLLFAAGAGVSLVLAALYPWTKYLFEFPSTSRLVRAARRRPVATA